MLQNKGLTVAKATEILNCDVSYIYKLIKRGKLEVAEAKPKTTVTPTSVINYITADYPFLKDMYSSISYKVAQNTQSNWH